MLWLFVFTWWSQYSCFSFISQHQQFYINQSLSTYQPVTTVTSVVWKDCKYLSLMVLTFIMTFLILILIHLEPRYLQLTLSSTFLTVLAQIRFPLAFSKFAHLISKLAANYALQKSRVINTGLTNWIVYL